MSPVDGTGRFSRSFFPIMGDTPYIELHDHYTGTCVTMTSGFSYLAVSESSPGPIDLHKRFMKLGLHLVDMQLAEGDLVEMISRRAAKL